MPNTTRTGMPPHHCAAFAVMGMLVALAAPEIIARASRLLVALL